MRFAWRTRNLGRTESAAHGLGCIESQQPVNHGLYGPFSAYEISKPQESALMKRTQLARSIVFAALASGTLLSGCVVRGSVGVPAPAVYVGGTVSVAPPPPQVEVIGVPPQPGYVWLGGYWNWVGGRHVWVGGGWRLREGHWAR